jgi:hypothetical protein
MSLERTILDVLAATLVAMDGARAGPIDPPIRQAELNIRVIQPVLTSGEAGSFRLAIEKLAIEARSLLGGTDLDPAVLSSHIEQLTGHLLAIAGVGDPMVSALNRAIAQGLREDLSERLLSTSFLELASLDGLDLGLDVVGATPPPPQPPQKIAPPSVPVEPIGRPGIAPALSPAVGSVGDDELFAAPLVVTEPVARNWPANLAPDPSLPAERWSRSAREQTLPESPVFTEAVTTPPAMPARASVPPPAPYRPPSSPMVAAIASRYGLAEIGLLMIAQHPAVATVSLGRLEAVLENSAAMLQQLAAGLMGGANEPAANAMERQAQMAILDGDLPAADSLLSGLAARESTLAVSPTTPPELERTLRRRIAEICAWRAGLAEARLDHSDAANFYHSAISALPGEDVEMAWLCALRQGTALQTAFEYMGDPQALEDAVVVYAQAIERGASNGPPQQSGLATLWVLTQNSLGNALTVLGERNNDLERLRLAAWSYGQALSGKNKAQGPAEWALLQANYAHAVMKVADAALQGKQPQPLDLANDSLTAAIAAWQAAAQVYAARNEAALHFDALMNQAVAHARLGFMSKDKGTLQGAAETLAAAAGITPASASLADRIRIASNLGNVCAELAEQSSERAWLDRAIEAYEAAFELVSTDPVSPPGSAVWAGAATNLANALWTAGRLSGDRNQLLKADNLFSSAAAAFEAEQAMQPAAAIHHALKELRVVLQQLQAGQIVTPVSGLYQSMTMR